HRASCHRSKHGTNSSRQSLHAPRVISNPTNNVANGLTNTFAEILNSRRNVLNPLIEILKEIPQVRVHLRYQAFTQLTHSSPRQRHRTSHRLSGTLRRPTILLFHDAAERLSVNLTVRHHLPHLFTSDTEFLSKSRENVDTVLSEPLHRVTHKTPIAFDTV